MEPKITPRDLHHQGKVMNSKAILKDQNGDVKLPDYYSRGFCAVVDGHNVHINIPGFSSLSAIPSNDLNEAKYKIAQFLLTHFHPDASHNSALVAEFEKEFVSPTIEQGGLVPNETIKDYLFYKGKVNKLVGGQ